MKIVPFVFVVVVMGLSSCSKRSSRPEGILSRQDMVKVLSEVYITEEKVKRLGVARDSSMKVFSDMRVMIFEKYAVSDSAFKRSLDYYWNRPEEMEEIYTALIDTLNLREQRQSLQPTPQ